MVEFLVVFGIVLALNFSALYSVLWLFERKKRDLDGFEITAVVIVPMVVIVFFQIIASILDLGVWSAHLALVIFLAMTSGMLWRILAIPGGRALAYPLVLIFLDFSILLLFVPR